MCLLQNPYPPRQQDSVLASPAQEPRQAAQEVWSFTPLQDRARTTRNYTHPATHKRLGRCGMTSVDYMALHKAAQRAGLSPIHLSVFAGLLSYCNARWVCHPSQRTLAELCSVNKDTVTSSIKWLAELNIIKITAKPRAVSIIEIRRKSEWKICPNPSDSRTFHLSGSTAQIKRKSVRTRRTVQKTLLHRNCPAPSDVNKGSAQGAVCSPIGEGVFLEPSAEVPHKPVNGHRIAFP